MSRPEQLPGWEPTTRGCWTRLGAEMDQQGLSRKKLAENAGVCRQQITEYRNGRRLPNGRSMLLIADALDCHVEQLWRLTLEEGP